MEYCVYVLMSIKNGRRYVGLSSKKPQIRLKEHNEGSNKYTRSGRPYKLLYFELGYCKECAHKRERFLKSGQGRILIDIIVMQSERSSIG